MPHYDGLVVCYASIHENTLHAYLCGCPGPTHMEFHYKISPTATTKVVIQILLDAHLHKEIK